MGSSSSAESASSQAAWQPPDARKVNRAKCSAEPLEDHRHALAAAHAHGLQAQGRVVELQAVQQGGGDARPGHAERVPDRDGAAVHVELGQVDAEVGVRRDDLGRERLVDLHQVDVGDGHPGPGERLPGRLHRSQAHDLRGQRGHPGGHDPRQRRDAELGRLDVAHHHDRRGPVVERAAVPRGDRAVRAEHRLQRGDLLHRGPGPGTVVGADHGAVRQGDGGYLALPEAVGDGLLGQVLRADPELVLLLAARCRAARPRSPRSGPSRCRCRA